MTIFLSIRKRTMWLKLDFVLHNTHSTHLDGLDEIVKQVADGQHEENVMAGQIWHVIKQVYGQHCFYLTLKVPTRLHKNAWQFASLFATKPSDEKKLKMNPIRTLNSTERRRFITRVNISSCLNIAIVKRSRFNIWFYIDLDSRWFWLDVQLFLCTGTVPRTFCDAILKFIWLTHGSEIRRHA